MAAIRSTLDQVATGNTTCSPRTPHDDPHCAQTMVHDRWRRADRTADHPPAALTANDVAQALVEKRPRPRSSRPTRC